MLCRSTAEIISEKYMCLKVIKDMDNIDSEEVYKAPQVKVIEIKVQSVLCQSPGNEPMREYDYGDGGFSEE